jgi:peptidoglycan biosynthesis protein MviN/MurJ (putative lipid II flippase)
MVMLILYALSGSCIVYKLAYLLRQTAHLTGQHVVIFRVLMIAAATLIILRTADALDMRDRIPVELVISRGVWCGILVYFILLIGRTRKVW